MAKRCTYIVFTIQSLLLLVNDDSVQSNYKEFFEFSIKIAQKLSNSVIVIEEMTENVQKEVLKTVETFHIPY